MRAVRYPYPMVVNAPLVVSETIDGEAIIMHHGSGRYFDISGSGVLVWSAIEQCIPPTKIAAQMAASYRLSSDHAADIVDAFLDTLVGHDLVRADPAAPLAMAPVAAPASMPLFVAPVLGVHDDLADMLLLDPIHDVDEIGWPAPQAPRSAA